jgi:tRNA (adenine22-N1)-methyltransferase
VSHRKKARGLGSVEALKPLSARLDTVLSMLAPCSVLADVCTDHGLVPVTAVMRGLATHAIAADLREAPLLVARGNIERAGVASRVRVVQGDGLLPLTDHNVDAIVMAGVSASLIVSLCDAAPHVLAHVKQLITQPNSEVSLMRSWALEHGWRLRDERMVYENERFFTVCAFAPGTAPDPAYAISGWTAEALCEVGPLLLTRKDPVARNHCHAQRTRLSRLVHEGVHKLEPELQTWQAACDYVS